MNRRFLLTGMGVAGVASFALGCGPKREKDTETDSMSEEEKKEYYEKSGKDYDSDVQRKKQEEYYKKGKKGY